MTNRNIDGVSVERPSKNGRKRKREVLEIPNDLRNRAVVTQWIDAQPNGKFVHQLQGKYFTDDELRDRVGSVSRVFGKNENDKGFLTYMCFSMIDLDGDSLMERVGMLNTFSEFRILLDRNNKKKILSAILPVSWLSKCFKYVGVPYDRKCKYLSAWSKEVFEDNPIPFSLRTTGNVPDAKWIEYNVRRFYFHEQTSKNKPVFI